MRPLAYEDLARLPVVNDYAAAFRKATGVTLRLVPPEGTDGGTRESRQAGNPFCALVGSTSAGCAACVETETQALRATAHNKMGVHQSYCYAGLTVVTAPVIVEGRHVATLLSGQIFRREPTERDFSMVVRMLGGGAGTEWVRKARKAYFETPVLTVERFQAAIQLLEVFRDYLAEIASRQAIARAETEPEAVASAKEFVQAHVDETLSLGQIVRHVNVSRFYFCKLFKRATGMTLTEYVTRVRLERAKALLSDPSRRVSEVVYAAGFGSIPHFNNVFKRQVGVPPSQYRANLRTQSPR